MDQQVAGGGAGLAVEHVGIAGLAELDRLDGLLDLIHGAINIDTDEEQADDFILRIGYRRVFGHVVMTEQRRLADEGLAGANAGVGRVATAQLGADGPVAIFLLQRGGDTQEIVALANENGRHVALAELVEIIDLAGRAIERHTVKFEDGRLAAFQGKAAGHLGGKNVRPALGLFAQDGIGLGNHAHQHVIAALELGGFIPFIDAADFSGQEYGETAQ